MLRFNLTVAVCAALLAAGAAAAAVKHPASAKHHASTGKLVQLFWNGSPEALLGHTRMLGTVPAGYTWTIKYVLPVTEKLLLCSMPVGGDGTVDLMVDGTPVVESSLATGQRVEYQGQGPMDVTLYPGDTVSMFTFINPADPVSCYFVGLAVTIEQTPLT